MVEARPALFMSGVRVIVNLADHLLHFLMGFPLAIAAVATLWHLPFDWRFAVMIALDTVCTVAVTVITMTRDINFSLDEVFQFLMDFPWLEFTPIPIAEYLSSLPASATDIALRRRILPSSDKLDRNRIRLLVPHLKPDWEGPLPHTVVTFGNLAGAWIILKDRPVDMTGLGHFTALHEIGHTAIESSIVRLNARSDFRRVVVFLFFLLLKVTISPQHILALAALSSIWYALARKNRASEIRRYRAYDELYADFFAFKRCDVAWFRNFPAQALAFRLCSDRGDYSIGSENRIRVFAENVERLRAGLPLKTLRESIQFETIWDILENVVFVSIFVIGGLCYAPVSNLRLVILAIVTSILLVGLAMVYLVQILQTQMADHAIGYKSMDPAVLEFAKRIFGQARSFEHALKRFGASAP
jgi:hypothetical protein